MTPDEIFAAYVDHLHEREFLDRALAEHSPAQLIDAAIIAVERGQPHPPLTLVRDAAIGVFSPESADTFRAAIVASRLFDALEAALDADDFSVRAAAVYTFGKLSFPETAPRLARAFERRRESDPFLLPDLLFELRWLEQQADPPVDGHRARLATMVASSSELTRWAAVVGGEDSVVQQLSADPSPRVAAEARFRSSGGNQPAETFEHLAAQMKR